jgi:hypothetical protein
MRDDFVIEEHEVQIKDLMALKKVAWTRWREQGKGDDACARIWNAYCLSLMLQKKCNNSENRASISISISISA